MAKAYFIRVSGMLSVRDKVPGKAPGEAAKFVLHALELNVSGGPGPFRDRLLTQRQNEARVRAFIATMTAMPSGGDDALQKRWEAELQALGYDPESLRKRVDRTFPDKT